MSIAPAQTRILIADDDVAFGCMLRAFLGANGMTCRHVPDGEQALAALAQESYELLIADIGMPGNFGLELVRGVAALPVPVPVVLLTGSPTVDTAMKAVGLPVAAYLTKPPEQEQLLSTIRHAVADVGVSRAVVASHDRLQKWVDELGRIKDMLRRAPHGGSTAYFDNYISITLGNLVGALADFAEVADMMVHSRSRQQAVEVATLVKALEETVTVIEHTRRNFHSKELCALRKKLELLLDARDLRKAGEYFSVKSGPTGPIITST